MLAQLAEAVRAVVAWLATPAGLVVLGVLLVALWTVALYGYRRRRRAVNELAAAVDEEGTTTA